MPSISEKRAEARTRYYTRNEAMRIGWDVEHPSRGGSFLEEQEIVDYFPLLEHALGQQRPDFATLLEGKLSTVIECKSNWHDIETAASEATQYADLINKVSGYTVRIAVGVAGTPDKRLHVRCLFKNGVGWTDLISHGYPLTQLPAPGEAKLAILNGDGTTDVQLPDEREFFSAALEISRILRLAKIEESIRPKVIGAIVLALYHGEFSMSPDVAIENINTNVKAAISKIEDVPQSRRNFLAQTLTLSTEAQGLRPRVEEIINQLERLNVRSIMRSGVDFLGQFYETFLRYGQDSKKLGIVFTPRHITRMCADLVGVELGNTVYDPACGTGGFLVAAFDKMMVQATTSPSQRRVRESLFGFDTNPTVWSLSVLNMFFRGDGKSNIVYQNCFESKDEYVERFDRALLNPPFSQEGEPETDFIDHALESVKPGGRVAAVVKTRVLVDPQLKLWRKSLVTNHHVEAVITLPIELFYPTGSPTVVLIARAHCPNKSKGTMVARIENDGFEISKKRRVPRPGSQIETVLSLFKNYELDQLNSTIPNLVTIVPRDKIVNGDEICAEQWLPSNVFGLDTYETYRVMSMRQLSLAIANYPDVVDEVIENFEEKLTEREPSGRPNGRAQLCDWFCIETGRSSGSKNYAPGSVPFISSGDSYNGIAAFIEPQAEEAYTDPCITVSAFGQACVQPWKFCARGNGGSAVRVLRPRHAMSVQELFWFIGQINSQRWRFHYGRMAIRQRLGQLCVDPPPSQLPDIPLLKEKLFNLRWGLDVLIGSKNCDPMEDFEDASDVQIAMKRLNQIRLGTETLVSGRNLMTELNRMVK